MSAVAVVAAIGVGPGVIWNLFGSPDLGPINFRTLTRRSTPNDSLAAAPDLCSASSDVLPPEFAVEANVLRSMFGTMLASETSVERVAADDAGLTDRYVQRSALMRYPDTVVVQFFGRPNGWSTLALYSRSQIGRNDFGVNRARIERWLDKLKALAPVA